MVSIYIQSTQQLWVYARAIIWYYDGRGLTRLIQFGGSVIFIANMDRYI